MTEFKEAISTKLKQNAKVIYKLWSDNGDEDLYSEYGPVVEEIFVQSGLVTDDAASIKRREEEKAKQKAKEDKVAICKPTVTGRSRAQIREAFLAAAVGGVEDTTGIWKLLESKAHKHKKGYSLRMPLFMNCYSYFIVVNC